MKVSIIIPHYNSVGKLINLLETINDEKEYIEVIIVDDRSTHDLQLVDDYIKNRSNISLYKNNKETKGAGACRNIGVEKATGNWLLFADADDYFVDKFHCKIEKAVNNHQNMDIIYFSPTSINLDDGSLSNRHIECEQLIKRYVSTSSKEDELKLRCKFLVPWSKLYRTSFIRDNSFLFDEIMVSNDTMFSAKAGIQAKNIIALEETIYVVTKDKGTLTTTKTKENFMIRHRVFLTLNKYCQNELNKKEYKSLDIYSARMLIDGYLLYKIKFVKLIKCLYIYSTAGIRFIPILELPQKILNYLKRQKLEKRF